MNINKERIYNILKYNIDGKELWIYSTFQDDDDSHKYYMLTIENNVPIINDIANPIETLQNMHSRPKSIKDDPYEYMKFIAYKNIAENNTKLKISH